MDGRGFHALLFFFLFLVFYYFTWAFPTDPKVFLQGAFGTVDVLRTPATRNDIHLVPLPFLVSYEAETSGRRSLMGPTTMLHYSPQSLEICEFCKKKCTVTSLLLVSLPSCDNCSHYRVHVFQSFSLLINVFALKCFYLLYNLQV